MEAMSYGIPVIGTDIAFEGLDMISGENCIVANMDNEFVDAIIRLYYDMELQKKISRNSLEYMKRFTDKKLGSKILESVEDLLE
jgi:glycosyltransferase involved in cell wall biosynthesis